MELYILETGGFLPLTDSWGIPASASADFCKSSACSGEEKVVTLGAHPWPMQP